MQLTHLNILVFLVPLPIKLILQCLENFQSRNFCVCLFKYVELFNSYIYIYIINYQGIIC